MIVKVLLKRYVPKEKESELLGLIRALRTLTTKQPGYVSGETFKRIDNPGESLVISIWQSLEDWERWVNSTERQVGDTGSGGRALGDKDGLWGVSICQKQVLGRW